MRRARKSADQHEIEAPGLERRRKHLSKSAETRHDVWTEAADDVASGAQHRGRRRIGAHHHGEIAGSRSRWR